MHLRKIIHDERDGLYKTCLQMQVGLQDTLSIPTVQRGVLLTQATSVNYQLGPAQNAASTHEGVRAAR